MSRVARKGPDRQPNKIVTQHNNLINSYFDITTVQLRAFVYALGHIHKNDTKLNAVRIPVDMLYSSLGGNNYRQVTKLTTELQKIQFKIETDIIDRKGNPKKHHKSFVIFPTAEYTEDSKFIVTKINEDLTPYLLDLKGDFTQAELERLMSFKTIQAYRIYMFIKQNLYLSNPRPIKYSDMRLMLGLDVLLEDTKKKVPEMDLFGEIPSQENPPIQVVKYPLFADFRKRVLEQAQKELQDTDLAFEFDLIRRGKSIDSIAFKVIKDIPVAPKPSKEPEEIPMAWKRPFERMLEYGLTDRQAHTVMNTIPLEALNPVLYKIQCDVRDRTYEKLNVKRTKGQHSVILLKEAFTGRFGLWRKGEE